MPESFDSMLAEMADAAVYGTRLPAPAAVRGRGRQRMVRRRVINGALAFALLAGGAGTAAALVRNSPSTTVGPVAGSTASPMPSSGAGTPQPAPSGEPSPSSQAGTPSPSSSGLGSSPGLSGVPLGVIPTSVPSPTSVPTTSGLWELVSAKSTSVVVVYPDGYVAMSAPNTWFLCLASLGASTGVQQFALNTGGCSSATPTPSTTLAFLNSGKELTIRSGSSLLTYTYAGRLGGPTPITGAAELARTWPATTDPTGNPDERQLIITQDGSILWSYLIDGVKMHGQGSLEKLFDGGYFALMDCNTTGDVPCGALQIEMAQDGNLLVYGSDGVTDLSWK